MDSVTNLAQAQAILEEELNNLANRIRANHVNAGQVASGRTLASIRAYVTLEEGVLYGRLLGHSPFGVLETGRRPGNIPGNLPEIIRQWMNDKGVHGTPIPYKTDRPHKYTPQERGDMSMAGAIAHSIAQKGTRLFQQGGRADIYSNEIPQALERIGERLGAYFAASLEDVIRLNTQKV